MMTGVGYREPLTRWLTTKPVECLEITAEHFYGRNETNLAQLAQDFHLFVHGLGLSLGSPGGLDREQLTKFAKVVEVARPDWISEHVAFTRTAEVDLGHLNPIRPTRAAAQALAANALKVSEHCGKPLILENITSHLQLEGELSETDFLNEVCAQSGCGLLLDVTNLFINSRNHGFDPVAWLHELPADKIVQMHIVGYSQTGNRWVDDHAAPVQDELLQLAREVVDYAPVKAIILERDTAFPGDEEMQGEMAKLRSLRG